MGVGWCVSYKGIFISEEVAFVVRTVAQIFQLRTISGSRSQQSAEVRVDHSSTCAVVRSSCIHDDVM